MSRRLLAGALVASLLLAPGVRAQEGPARTVDLPEALRLALARNPRIVAARRVEDAARAGVSVARAKRWPLVEASVGYVRIENPPTIDLGSVEAELGERDAGYGIVSASQSVWAGGAVGSRIRAARRSLSADAAARRAVEEEVALDVHRRYYGVLLARSALEVRRAAVRTLETHAAEIRERFERGDASEYEALRAEVELANERPGLVSARHDVERARDVLTRALGLDPTRSVAVEGRLEEAEKSFEGRATEPGAQRPELRAARMRVEAAEAGVAVARAARRPTVSAFGRVFWTRPEYLIGTGDDGGWNALAGLDVRLPVFTGFAAEARIEAARARRAEALARADDLASGIELEAREARRRIAEARETIAAGERTIEQAERALAIARVRYAHGLGTQLEVTDALLALDEARLIRLTALHEALVAEAELRWATGVSLLPPEDAP